MSEPMRRSTHIRRPLLILWIALSLALPGAPALACDEECGDGYVFSDSQETCVPKEPPST